MYNTGMDTTDPEFLVKLAEKIADETATPEELDFFLREFNKVVSEVKEEFAVDTLKATLNNAF
jgi:hypothetical protein